jgi:dUTP pyrophosphatase
MCKSSVALEVLVVRLTSRALLPQKGHPTDAGFDLAIPEDCILGGQKRLVIDLEIVLQIPDGWYGQIFGRSSVFQHGLFINPGVIDAGYRGAVQLLVENQLHSTQHLQRGDRLAQLLFLPVPAVTLKWVAPEALNRTLRGTGGLGSTGR